MIHAVCSFSLNREIEKLGKVKMTGSLAQGGELLYHIVVFP